MSDRPWPEIDGTLPGVTGYTIAELRNIWQSMLDGSVHPLREKRLACMAVGLANQLGEARAATARVRAYAAQHADWCCAKGCTAPEDPCDEACNCESGAILAALEGTEPPVGTGHQLVHHAPLAQQPAGSDLLHGPDETEKV